MSWYKLTLTQDQEDLCMDLSTDFHKAFVSRGKPAGIALYRNAFTPGNAVDIFFRPDCAKDSEFKYLIDNYGAVPCEEPEFEKVQILVGPGM